MVQFNLNSFLSFGLLFPFLVYMHACYFITLWEQNLYPCHSKLNSKDKRDNEICRNEPHANFFSLENKKRIPKHGESYVPIRFLYFYCLVTKKSGKVFTFRRFLALMSPKKNLWAKMWIEKKEHETTLTHTPTKKLE